VGGRVCGRVCVWAGVCVGGCVCGRVCVWVGGWVGGCMHDSSRVTAVCGGG